MRTLIALTRLATVAAFTLLAALMALSFVPAAMAQSDIGYDSPAAAFDDLKNRPGVEISRQPGFIVIAEPGAGALWTFTDTPHPAHPAVVKRQVVVQNGEYFVDMRVLCGASKARCDELVAAFTLLNEQMAQSLRSGR